MRTQGPNNKTGFHHLCPQCIFSFFISYPFLLLILFTGTIDMSCIFMRLMSSLPSSTTQKTTKGLRTCQHTSWAFLLSLPSSLSTRRWGTQDVFWRILSLPPSLSSFLPFDKKTSLSPSPSPFLPADERTQDLGHVNMRLEVFFFHKGLRRVSGPCFFFFFSFFLFFFFLFLHHHSPSFLLLFFLFFFLHKGPRCVSSLNYILLLLFHIT